MNLKQCRESLKLSKADAVNASGLPRTTYLHAENQTRSVATATLKTIVEAFHKVALKRLHEISDSSARLAVIEFLANPLGVPPRIELEFDATGGMVSVKQGAIHEPYRAFDGRKTVEKEARAQPETSSRIVGCVLPDDFAYRNGQSQPNIENSQRRSSGTTKGRANLVTGGRDFAQPDAGKQGSPEQTQRVDLVTTASGESAPLVSNTDEPWPIKHAREALSPFKRYSNELSKTLDALHCNEKLILKLEQYVAGISVSNPTFESLYQLCQNVRKNESRFERAIVRVIQEIGAALLAPTDSKDPLNYIRKKLSPALNGERLRTRESNECAARIALHNQLGAELLCDAQILTRETQDSARTLLTKKRFYEDALKDDIWSEKISTAYGYTPSLQTLYNDALKYLPRGDRSAQVKKYLAPHLGVRGEYAGQMWGLDGTGLEDIVNVSAAKFDKQDKLFGLYATDWESGLTISYADVAKSESELWPAAIHFMLQKWCDLGAIPEILICDRIGKLFLDFDFQRKVLEPGLAAPQFNNPTLLLLLSAGVRMYWHLAGNPRGKAIVERHIRAFKTTAAHRMQRRLREFRMQNNIADARRMSRTQMSEFMKAVDEEKNGTPIRGLQKSPLEIFTSEEARNIVARAKRAPINNDDPATIQKLYNKIYHNAYVSRLDGHRIKVCVDGRVQLATLSNYCTYHSGETSATQPEFEMEPIVISVPKGLLARDENSGTHNILIIEPRKGAPRYWMADSTIVEMTEYGKPSDLSTFGTFQRVPDSVQQRDVRKINQIVNAELARRSELRSGLAILGKRPGEGLEQLTKAEIEAARLRAEEADLMGNPKVTVDDLEIMGA